MTAQIEPFRIETPSRTGRPGLAARTRWLDELPGLGWAEAPLDYLRDLAEYRRTGRLRCESRRRC